ncbi:Vegetative incompatibility protein HET-E-1 [Ceratocystis lukuohia]|uniref:Vegetative incompatibility protein HET-E-1 n=1 Tax=Ceratocystis lukuohia TaxID=2019550 RepID=A0ABR4M8M0_9PEZI
MSKTDTNELSPPTILATYNMPHAFAGCKIWEVARATYAADQCSDSITRGQHRTKSVDDSFGYSNPCEALIKEAESIFPGRMMVTASVGAGLGPIVNTEREEPSIKRSLMRITTRSELVHQKLVSRYISPGVYYRFNVEDGFKDVTTPVHDEIISAHTRNYLAENDHIFQELADIMQS